MQRDGMKGKKALSGLCLAAVALVIVWVSWRNGIVNYYLVSTLVLLLSLGAFFLAYERKKATAQELVLLAVLCAVAVVGRMAGVCFRPGRLPRTRMTLTLFGALCVLLPVGLILDTSSLFLMTGDPLTVDSALAIYLAGISANVIHAAATAFFLFLIGPVVLEKLERVKVKYGLME